MNEEMNELFLSFTEQSDIVQDCLSKILENVTEGKIPSSEDVKTLDNGLKNLRNKYDLAYEAAQSAVLPDKLPEHGSAIASIITAVEDSENNRILQQLSDARNVLEKFISVRSLVEEYANAISSYQREAHEILEQLNPSTIDDLYPKTEAPALFLHVMDLAAADIHNSTGIALMKKLKQFYHEDEIQYGLIGQKYFYDNELSAEDRQTNETEISDRNHKKIENVNKSKTEAKQGTKAEHETKSKQKTETEQEAEAKPEVLPKTKRQPSPIRQPNPKIQPKANEKLEKKEQPKTNEKQTSKVQPKANDKPETKVQPKTKRKPEAKEEHTTEADTDLRIQYTDVQNVSFNAYEEDKCETVQPLKTDVNTELNVDEDVFIAANQASIARPHPADFKKELSTMCMEYVEVASILSLFTHFGFMNYSQIYLSFYSEKTLSY